MGYKSFTLFEVILTIVIMGLLAGVVLPRFVKSGFIEGLTLRTTTSQITEDLSYARQLAITNSRTYIIKFDFLKKEYAIYKDSISAGNQIGEIKKIPSEITCSGTDQFDFYALGNCSFIGDGIALFLDTSQYEIKVEPPSGAVVVEKIA